MILILNLILHIVQPGTGNLSQDWRLGELEDKTRPLSINPIRLGKLGVGPAIIQSDSWQPTHLWSAGLQLLLLQIQSMEKNLGCVLKHCPSHSYNI